MNVSPVVRLCLALTFAVGFTAVSGDSAVGQIFRRPQGRPVAKPSATNPDAAKPATGKPDAAKHAVEERFIIVPGDEKPFGVDRTDLVRLPASGIAGSEFSAKIEGPARLRRQAYITRVFDGESPIGGAEAELEFEMTGPGKVKIDVIVTYPNGPAKVTTYQFEVVRPKN